VLQNMILRGAQHPPSESWVKNAKFFFDAKIGFLSGYKTIAELKAAGGVGRTTMFEYSADGLIRTVLFDLNKSEFTSPSDFRVWWEGGYRYEPPQ